jgi:hypothetical protein
MKRIIVLVAMTMVAVMLLSGPVAQVLEVPGEGEAFAANKKKKKKRNRVVTINCPNRADGETCVGTTGRDRLVGTNAFDYILGRAGNDVYYPKGGSDILWDNSISNDYYYESVLDFGNLRIRDDGGINILDLSNRYESDDFFPERDGNDLLLREAPGSPGDGTNRVRIIDYFTTNTFFYFYFSDGFANDALQSASASEQAQVEEQVDADSPTVEQISSDNGQDTTNSENTES